MPFDTTDAAIRMEEHHLRQTKARRRQVLAAIRAGLRTLEPGQVGIIPWANGCDRQDYRRDIVWLAYLLWGAKAASVVPVERGCLVTRHRA